MGAILLRMLTAVQLTRLTMAFGAVSDVWFVILFTRHHERYEVLPVSQMPLWSALLAGGVVAVGLFAYAAALNDVLDARHDSAFSPDRPIPAGRIRSSQAIVVAVGALLIAVLAGATLGAEALRLTLLVAAAILFYDAAGKHVPGVGLVVIGLLHALHMFIPNFELAFTLPVWLVMTHTMAITLLVHLYEEKRPLLSRRAIGAIVVGWLTWSIVIIMLGTIREGFWPGGWRTAGAVYPAAAVVTFLIVAWWKTARSTTGQAAGEKLKRYGAMWQSLYGAAWLFAVGQSAEAGGLLVFAALGFVAMTAIKEVAGVSGQPISFRA